MGVENGPSGGIGTAVSIGPAISIGPAVSSVGAISGLGRFGEVMRAPIAAPVSEGFVPASFLKHTVPLAVNELRFDKGGERFDFVANTPIAQSQLNEADAIFEAESIFAGNAKRF